MTTETKKIFIEIEYNGREDLKNQLERVYNHVFVGVRDKKTEQFKYYHQYKNLYQNVRTEFLNGKNCTIIKSNFD